MMMHDVTSLPIQRVETRSGALGVIVEGQAGRLEKGTDSEESPQNINTDQMDSLKMPA
ncbi:hypothetical protein [Phytopseudomonas argentinensis]|uniref:hypothetical protein n=1 Tax=Phytopseudomonas argentinensis TaxID=289370 RepID=UPI0014289A46|nr:hypothetical protein [Pseudomonas argentinensis]